MRSLELTALITAAANSLALKVTDSELALLSSILVQLGDTLATIAAERDFIKETVDKERA